MTIKIMANPAGYSRGTYGWVVTWTDDLDRECSSSDGGFASPELAREAAQAFVAREGVAS